NPGERPAAANADSVHVVLGTPERQSIPELYGSSASPQPVNPPVALPRDRIPRLSLGSVPSSPAYNLRGRGLGLFRTYSRGVRFAGQLVAPAVVFAAAGSILVLTRIRSALRIGTGLRLAFALAE